MRARRVLGTATLLWALLGGPGCDGGTVTSEYDLSGYVLASNGSDRGTSPVGGATVRFTSDTGLSTMTRSDERGRYEMQIASDIAFGQVRAEAEGFVPAEASVYFDAPQRRIDLIVDPR